MRRGTWVLLSSCGAVLGLLAIGLPTQDGVAQGRPSRSGVPEAEPAEQLTRLQLDVFELTCTYGQLARFELEEIGAGKPSTAEVLERLGRLGTARVMLRYDNVVHLPAENFVGTGMRVPAVEDMSVSSGGVITPSVSYEGVGFRGTISGHWFNEGDPMQAEIRFEIECSDLSEESVAIAEGVHVPVFAERLVAEGVRVLRSREPVWLACNDLELSAVPDSETKLTLVRLTATRLTD